METHREGLWEFLAAFEEVDMRGGDGKIAAMEAWAEKEAEKAAQGAATDATKKFREWLQGGSAKGLSRQHAMSKCAGQWVQGKTVKEKMNEDALTSIVGQWGGGCGETVLGKLVATIQARGQEVERPANVQQEVDLERGRWAKEWAADEVVEECKWPDEIRALPDISAQMIGQACATFRDGVGLGWDRLRPKDLDRLPGAMLDELGRLLGAAEDAGSWEEAVGIVITALIPKGDGG